MTNTKLNVVFLDCTQNYGYQYSASNTKVELMAKGLIEQGAEVCIHNGATGKKGLKTRESNTDSCIGTVITYPYHFPQFGWLLNRSMLKRDLRDLYKDGYRNVVILSNVSLDIYNYYKRLAKKIGYYVVAISHEWVPTVKRRFWYQNLLAKRYASTFGHGIDAIQPISEYIIERIKQFGIPWLKTPILAEYPNLVTKDNRIREITYCVFAFYTRVIFFILNAYKKYVSSSENPIGLTLVLSGPSDAIDTIRERIRELGLESFVTIKSKLPYTELFELYKSSCGLLIPLDPSHEQDYARFSQKIAEYASSGTPIITNSVGEIPYYFSSGEDIITCEYSVDGFSNTFHWLESHIDEADDIGQNGYKTGCREFNYRTFAPKLTQFLLNI